MPEFRIYQSKQILCITVPELLRCGVSEGYLKKALNQQRNGKVSCWPHHKVGLQVYVHFDGIKPEYKQRIKLMLCDNVDPHLWVMNKEASKRLTEVNHINQQLPNLLEILPEDIRDLDKTGHYSKQDIHRIARAAAWLRLINSIDVKRSRKMGYLKITEFQEAVFKHVLSEQSKGHIKFKKIITNERVLDRNARIFKRDGIESLISGLMGNSNRLLINPLVHAELIRLACDQTKPSFEDIGMEYNSKALDMGLPMVTVDAIKQHLNDPKYKRIWYYHQHGKIEGDLEFRSEATRREVSRPDALWSIDGTTMQLYYRDEAGKIKSDLYTYFIADTHSGAIIGHAIGFTETSGLVTEALQKAVNFRNYIPYQLQYDNSSANVSGVVSGLMNNMTRVHFGCRPYSGQSKYIETFTGHFQQQVLHKQPNFKGGNITAKTAKAKANPELLKKYRDNPALLPSRDQVVEQFNIAISKWNLRGEGRDAYGDFIGKTKIERYEVEHPARTKVNYFDKISLFMSELPDAYTYKQSGIQITLKGQKYWFVVPDEGSRHDFIFQRNHLGDKFKVRINIENPEFCILFKDGKQVDIARDKDLFAACIADYQEGEGAKIKDFQKKQEVYGWKFAQSELDKQRALLEAHGLLKATGTDGIQSWQFQDKVTTNYIENQIQDELNGVAEASDLQLRLLKMLK